MLQKHCKNININIDLINILLFHPWKDNRLSYEHNTGMLNLYLVMYNNILKVGNAEYDVIDLQISQQQWKKVIRLKLLK